MQRTLGVCTYLSVVRSVYPHVVVITDKPLPHTEPVTAATRESSVRNTGHEHGAPLVGAVSPPLRRDPRWFGLLMYGVQSTYICT